MLSLASRAEPYRCSSRAVNGSHSTFRLLATCRQDARIPVLLLCSQPAVQAARMLLSCCYESPSERAAAPRVLKKTRKSKIINCHGPKVAEQASSPLWRVALQPSHLRSGLRGRLSLLFTSSLLVTSLRTAECTCIPPPQLPPPDRYGTLVLELAQPSAASIAPTHVIYLEMRLDDNAR